LSVNHREFDKEFQTEIKINGKQLSLNYFIQETLANTIIGFLKTLKEVHENEKIIEIKIEKMKEIKKVDAHTYP
jgi:hypothetical protein